MCFPLASSWSMMSAEVLRTVKPHWLDGSSWSIFLDLRVTHQIRSWSLDTCLACPWGSQQFSQLCDQTWCLPLSLFFFSLALLMLLEASARTWWQHKTNDRKNYFHLVCEWFGSLSVWVAPYFKHDKYFTFYSVCKTSLRTCIHFLPQLLLGIFYVVDVL